MSPAAKGNCWNCGQSLTEIDYGREKTCDQCGKNTRACRNCEFYDPMADNECHEPQADRVVDKESGNFCDYFIAGAHKPQGGPAKKDLKAAAEELFKKKK